MSRALGWYAELDTEAPNANLWQPWLQTSGLNLSFEVWFETEADCLSFIETELIGRGMLVAV